MRDPEGQLQLIINTIPTAAWTTRPDGYCDFINQVWLDYAGMTAEQTQGWGWAEAIHPDDRKKLVEDWQSCLASGTPVDTEARIRRFDGSYRWFLIRANPLRDESGNILKWYGTNIDIEDRKRGEEDLRARELSWRQIVDNVPGFVVRMTTGGEVEFVNRQILEYFGKTNEELKNWSLIGVVHPDDLPRIIETRKKQIEAGQTLEFEHRCRRADGVYRWFQVRGLPVRDAENKMTGWYLLLTDIDDRKRTEQILCESEAYLAEAQRLSQTGSWAWNPGTGDIRYWSEECFRMLGFDPHGPLPRFEEFLQHVHSNDRSPTRDLFEKAVRDKEDFELDYRLVHPEKGIRDIHAVGHAVLSPAGDLIEFVGTIIDFTERKHAEEELRQLVDFVPQHIMVLDSDGELIHANRVVQEYTGLTLNEFRTLDVIGRIIHSDDVERMRGVRERGLAGSEPFELDARVLGEDGLYRWFLYRYNPLLEQGRARRWFASATEIELRKQEEERVRKENVRLEERTRIAQELHDTLLQTFLSASMQLVVTVDAVPAESPAKPQLDRILQIMNRGIEEGRSTIQGLRSSDPRATDLVIALTGVQQELPVRPDIDFRVSVVGRQQPLPELIRQEVYRIAREALLNAFCHSGAKRVDCELEYADEGLQVRVRDDGIGIDPQVLHDGREGHWGLAGMRERAARIGGSLNVSSTPTAGTEVHLSIPSSFAASVFNDGNDRVNHSRTEGL